MNKYFKFTAILSLLTCVAHAQQMPLLQIELNRKDVQNLIAIQKQETLAQKIVQLTRFYPELEFGRLADTADEDGKLIRKYDNGASNRPKILLKWPTSPVTLPRALIHYFIDRARLAKHREIMESERLSFTRMLTAELIEINHGLMNATRRSDNSLKTRWQAMLTLNTLNRHLAGAGEDIEAIHFLIRHREEIGLNEEDLIRSHKDLQKDLDFISTQAILLIDEAAPMEEILKWQPLADRLLGVFDRLEEIEAYTSCEGLLVLPAFTPEPEPEFAPAHSMSPQESRF